MTAEIKAPQPQASPAEKKRLLSAEKENALTQAILYTILAYLPPYLLLPIFKLDSGTVASNLSMLLVTYSPMLANIFTRLITKDRSSKRYLMPGKGQGHHTLLYYALALLPILACTLGVLLTVCFNTDAKTLKTAFDVLFAADKSLPLNSTITVTTFLQTILYCIPLFFVYFGEEYGWRGYLTPRLMQLMPKPAAIIVSGIIWGAWHAPMTAQGHNFGKDYDFFPWLGIVLMCVFCILVGGFFSYLQEKTDSVYPACIAHALNNNITSVVLVMTVSAVPAIGEKNMLHLTVIAMIPMAVVGLIFTVLLLLPKKQNADKKA